SRTPEFARVRGVVGKQHGWHRALEHRARAKARARAREAARDVGGVVVRVPRVQVPFPWLVVISTGRPDTALEKYACHEVRRGWYEAVDGMQMRLIVLAEVPRTRETLVLRLLGAGQVLAEALDELSALPIDTWERSVAWPILLQFGVATEEQ